MKKLLLLALIALVTSPAFASEKQQNSNITTMLKELNFKFQPDVLQQEGFGEVKGYYENGDGFPLWLLLNMDGPVIVTPDRFGMNSNGGSDTLWTVDLSSVDSLNGLCQASFAIDPRNSRAALTIITPQESVTYLGSVSPVVDTQARIYKNSKIAEAAEETERTLDELIPKLNFKVKLNTETYGYKAYIILLPNKLSIPRAMLVSDKYEVLCTEKVGDDWYVSIEVPSKTEVKEPSVLNLVIDAKTGDTHYRLGPWNKQRKNWRDIVDGVASLNDQK